MLVIAYCGLSCMDGVSLRDVTLGAAQHHVTPEHFAQTNFCDGQVHVYHVTNNECIHKYIACLYVYNSGAGKSGCRFSSSSARANPRMQTLPLPKRREAVTWTDAGVTVTESVLRVAADWRCKHDDVTCAVAVLSAVINSHLLTMLSSFKARKEHWNL